MPFDYLLAGRTKRMGASAIRELLKVVSQPGMISLAGGIPAPESFPMELMGRLLAQVIDRYGSRAFQYDRTEGFKPLCEALADYLRKSGIDANPDQIYITCGSQGVLDAAAKILISRGQKVAVEAPTYVGAIQAFNPYEPEYVPVETDENGIIPEALETVLRKHKIQFVYMVPNFQNPSGRTLPLDRRKQIARMAQDHDVLILEDDPYGALRYSGEAVPPIRNFAPDHVIYTSTFSKIFAPGLRTGFFLAPPLIAKWMVLAKQGIDLHTSTLNQALAAEYITGGYLDNQIPKIVTLYRPKLQAMLRALDSSFPDHFTWSRPEGGMFVWVEGPPDFDAESIYASAVREKTAFVPGKYFFTSSQQGMNTMRLNFTMSTEADIEKAVYILAQLIQG